MITRPVALVTGGSRGIGRGICLELGRIGYAVAVNYAQNEEAARETRRLLELAKNPDGMELPQPLLCRADVAAAADRKRLLEEILSQWGRIDVLVNNAGITSIGRRDILEASEEGWERVLGVNLKGPFFLTQLVAREMIRMRQQLQPDGFCPAIINISSLSSYAVSTNRGDYCISKAGLRMMTRLFAVKLAEHAIRVFEICPGVIDTDMTAGARALYDRLIAEGLAPICRWGTAEDVGKAVAAVVSGAFPYSTGEVINVDGGFHLRRM